MTDSFRKLNSKCVNFVLKRTIKGSVPLDLLRWILRNKVVSEKVYLAETAL